MERETYFDGTSYTALSSKSECVQALGAYEDTGLKPEEITTKPYGCVFYCNRHCNLDGDWCVEGPGCQRELTKEQVFKLRDELGKYRSIGNVEEITRLSEEVENRFLLWVETHYRVSGGRLMELVEAEQKRREGCEYCKGDNPKGCVTVDIPDYEMLDEPTLRWVEAPKFCPICGRDLRGDSHG